MIDKLFDTKAKRDAAISKLANLKRDPGWLLVVEILTANIEVVKDLILHGTDNETKQTIDVLRERLNGYENLLDTPNKLIKQLESSTTGQPSMDPFYTLDELKDLRLDK